MIYAIAVLFALWIATAAAGSWVFFGWYRSLDAAPTAVLPSVEVFDPGPLERRIEVLHLAVSEGIERVDRSERRVQAVVGRARKDLASYGLENPALEAESSQLQLDDGIGSDEDGLRPLPDGVGAPEYDYAPSGIPGMTVGAVEQLRHVKNEIN